MITVTIDNSYSKIVGLSPKQEKELKSLLSYVVGGSSSYFSKYGSRRKSLLDKRGYFPTGLYDRVYRYLNGEFNLNLNFKYKDIPFIPNSKGLYKWQIEAANCALNSNRGIISATTGSGKSLVIKELIIRHNIKTLVIVPTLEIKKQLSEVLKDCKNTVIENIDSPKLEKLTNFDMLIIDEGHHTAAKTYQDLNKKAWTKISRRFFLTATPFRNDIEETLLFEAICGNVIYELSYKDAVKARYIVPIEAYYIESIKQKTDAHTYSEVYSELVVKNKYKNSQICNLLKRLEDNSVNTLCLVREIAHGKILSDLTGIPFVSGEDEESKDYIRQFNNGGIKAIIGTTGVLGEGIDTKSCEYVIIAGLGKAKSQFMQQVGRAVRKYLSKESAKVIIIKDTSHKFTLRHFNAQKKILLDEYGVKPLKLEI